MSLKERQKLLCNKIVAGFEGKLTTVKWAKITIYSPDTALGYNNYLKIR
jgi:hypothetical protein